MGTKTRYQIKVQQEFIYSECKGNITVDEYKKICTNAKYIEKKYTQLQNTA